MEEDGFPNDGDDLNLLFQTDSSNSHVTINKDGSSIRATAKKGEKRGIEEIDEDNDTTKKTSQGNTTINTASNMSKSSDDNNKVAPIIYFRINFELVKEQSLLENLIMDALKAFFIFDTSVSIFPTNALAQTLGSPLVVFDH